LEDHRLILGTDHDNASGLVTSSLRNASGSNILFVIVISTLALHRVLGAKLNHLLLVTSLASQLRIKGFDMARPIASMADVGLVRFAVLL
jgi:hypothetical protein